MRRLFSVAKRTTILKALTARQLSGPTVEPAHRRHAYENTNTYNNEQIVLHHRPKCRTGREKPTGPRGGITVLYLRHRPRW